MATSLTRTPITLKATERAAQLAAQGKLPAPPIETPSAPLNPSDVRARLAAGVALERQQAISRTLVPDAGPSAVMQIRPGEDYDGSTMSLPPSRILQYDKNPRKADNPKYEEIKASISIKGVTNIFTVTRRPGSADYMVYGGGNTRLKALQALELEQPDNPLFKRVTVVYRAWKNEADTIAAHLIENESRGDTTFWDKACGLASLKGEVELQEGRALSANEIRAHAATLGWKINRDNAQLYAFAVDFLGPIGPWLNQAGARDIRGHLNQLTQLVERFPATVVGGMEAAVASAITDLAKRFARIVSPEEAQSPDAPDVELVVSTSGALDVAVSGLLEQDVEHVRAALALLPDRREASGAALFAEVKLAQSTANRAGGEQESARSEAVQQVLPSGAILSGVGKPHQEGGPLGKDADFETRQGPLPDELTHSTPSSVRSAEQEGMVQSSSTTASKSQDPLNKDALHDIQVAGQAVHDAARRLADLTGVADLCVSSPTAPFGYWMELPEEGDLHASADSHLPAAQQILLKRGGWQLLAALSGQFDGRIQGPPYFPSDSAWATSARQGTLEDDIACCGCSVHPDGRVQIDLGSLFYLLTEPQLLAPCVAELIQRVVARRVVRSDVLPMVLQLFSRSTGHR